MLNSEERPISEAQTEICPDFIRYSGWAIVLGLGIGRVLITGVALPPGLPNILGLVLGAVSGCSAALLARLILKGTHGLGRCLRCTTEGVVAWFSFYFCIFGFLQMAVFIVVRQGVNT